MLLQQTQRRLLASAKAIKSYVDSQVTAQDLDFQGDTGGALCLSDLDSETLDIAGGTGIDSSKLWYTLTELIDTNIATVASGDILADTYQQDAYNKAVIW